MEKDHMFFALDSFFEKSCPELFGRDAIMVSSSSRTQARASGLPTP